MKFKKALTIALCAILIVLTNSGIAQEEKERPMEQLNYLVGEWIGTSKVYENGIVTKEGPAYEKISYDLDGSILVIELNSESLQLHTIIRYDQADQTYYYHPFYKEGTAKYPAEFKNGELVVNASAERRFIFRSTEDGGFQEYGEKLVDGEWVRYFEDNFINTK